MTQQQESPGGEAGALKRLARQLDGPEYNPLASKFNLRLLRLQRWHGLSGPTAKLIAGLAYDAGRVR